MRFVLIHVPIPDDVDTQARQAWGAFHANAGLGNLANHEGVFALSDAAWILDTRKSLVRYARVIHRASEHNVRLFVFELDAATALHHAQPSQKKDELAAFLAS